VAAGANACVLHYRENTAPLRKGDLMLIDAGCELESYAADITRTFPIGGRFSAAQRDVYELVLASQEAAIRAVKPGAPFIAYHDAATRVLVRGLIDMKLCKGSVDKVLEDGSYKQFYMHRTGHWLGLDVHDAGDYKRDGQWVLLEPGQVTTVEPGCYVRPGDKVPEAFWNIGIRIEDDAIVTETGCELISRGVPVKADEIEALMRG
jgi:Xaa-Pro aminopeptidase